MVPWLDRWLRLSAAWLRERLLVEVCLLCDAPAAERPNLCAACAQDLAALAWRLPGSPVTRLHAAFVYAPPVSTLIRAFKFRGDLAAGLTLGSLLAERCREQPGPRPDVLVPVPLHPSRLRQRGFNQAQELAEALGRRLELPLMPHLCRRVRDTVPQSDLGSARERLRNVTGAFAVSATIPDIQHVALVDDVVTTGATTRELSRVLRRAGVRRVDVWACARPARARPAVSGAARAGRASSLA